MPPWLQASWAAGVAELRAPPDALPAVQTAVTRVMQSYALWVDADAALHDPGVDGLTKPPVDTPLMVCAFGEVAARGAIRGAAHAACARAVLTAAGTGRVGP